MAKRAGYASSPGMCIPPCRRGNLGCNSFSSFFPLWGKNYVRRVSVEASERADVVSAAVLCSTQVLDRMDMHRGYGKQEGGGGGPEYNSGWQMLPGHGSSGATPANNYKSISPVQIRGSHVLRSGHTDAIPACRVGWRFPGLWLAGMILVDYPARRGE